MFLHYGLHRKLLHSLLYFLSTYPQAIVFSLDRSGLVFPNKGIHWPVTLVGCVC